MEFTCEFDAFTIDNPLNRILAEAARVVAGSEELPWTVRKAAMGALARMKFVGPLRSDDFTATVDRVSAHYADAISLARHVILGQGRLLQVGRDPAWSFLLRTPEPVEEGIRRLLQEHLHERFEVEKRGKQVGGIKMTFNPDLVFDGGCATGDVKYTLATGKWRRADIYQAIAFATIYDTDHAVVIGMRPPDSRPCPPITVGSMTLRHLDWMADPSIDPRDVASLLSSEVEGWLERIVGDSPPRRVAASTVGPGVMAL